jgi:twitching motility protein PilT
MKSIEHYFDIAVEAGASDLHLVALDKPMMRVNGQLQEIEEVTLPAKELETSIFSLLTAAQKKRFEEDWELDVGYSRGDVRFRINIHEQEGQIGLAARIISKNIPSPDALRFEPILREMPQMLDGLVLVEFVHLKRSRRHLVRKSVHRVMG